MRALKYLLLVVVLASCSMLDEDHFDIEDRLKLYVDQFYTEASARGITIQHENLLMWETYALSQKDGASGQSFPGSIPSVRIASDLLDEGDTLKIKFVVFHELGHALLYRGHAGEYDFSIMVPNDYLIGNFKTKPDLRKELIDELFSHVPKH